MKSKRKNASNSRNRKKTRNHRRKIANNNQQSVNIIETQKAESTNFGGYPIDLFFGLLYLKQKHSKLLALPFKIRDLITKYKYEIQQGNPTSFAGCLIFRCKRDIVDKDMYMSSEPESEELSSNNIVENNSKSKQKNERPKPIYKFNHTDFEIELPNKQSTESFLKVVIAKRNEHKRFMIIPLIFKWTCSKTQTGHANILFIDLKKREAERFEPYGKTRKFSKNEQAVADHFDQLMKEMFAKINFTFYKPSRYIPKKGPQYIEEKKIYFQKSNQTSEQESDPEGFCGAWSLWYADLRMTNRKKSRKRLLKKSIKKLKSNDISLRAFIRNYSKFILEKRREFLGKLDISRQNNNLDDYLKRFNSKKSELSEMLRTEKN